MNKLPRPFDVLREDDHDGYDITIRLHLNGFQCWVTRLTEDEALDLRNQLSALLGLEEGWA